MHKHTGNRRTIFIIVLLVILTAGLGFVLSGIGRTPQTLVASTQEKTKAAAQQAEPTEATTAEADDDSPTATLFFASDYQHESAWPAPRETLTSVLQAAAADGKEPQMLVYLGDYTQNRKLHDYQLSPENNIQEIREVVQQECPQVTEGDMIFVQGNHDRLTGSISDSGLHEYDNYLVYVLNTRNDFPWRQGQTSGSLKKVQRAAKKMKKCFDELITRGETRPVFIAGHVPLHFTARTSSRHTSGDNLYSSLIFNVVNEAGRSLDIVYLFGHNHSKGWDCYMGGACVYKAVGDTLLIPAFAKTDVTTDQFTEEQITFTYLNGGYSGYYMNCGPEELDAGKADQYAAADGTLTGTVCEIWPDELVLTRYDGGGMHPLGAQGEADPYKGGIDSGLIDAAYYADPVDSPQRIPRR